MCDLQLIEILNLKSAEETQVFLTPTFVFVGLIRVNLTVAKTDSLSYTTFDS